MLNRILGGVGLMLCALAAIWLYGKSQKHAGRMAERVEWHQQMQSFEKQAKDIIVSRVNTVREVERAKAEQSAQVGYDIQKRLSALSVAVERVRASRQGDSDRGGINLPATAEAAASVIGAGEASDMVACGEAVIKAEGWRQWYNEVAQ